jgi:hypothetical protein
MTSPPSRVRRRIAAAAVVISQRVKPLPCPYALRWTTDVPRPYLTRRKVVEILEPVTG